jgi:hypothetical protein
MAKSCRVMTLTQYEKKYSDTSSECDLSQAFFFFSPEPSCFLHVQTHKTFWHINSSTPLIHKLYIISSRSSGLLMSPCHIKKSILSIDREFMAEIRASSITENLLQTSKAASERVF